MSGTLSDPAAASSIALAIFTALSAACLIPASPLSLSGLAAIRALAICAAASVRKSFVENSAITRRGGPHACPNDQAEHDLGKEISGQRVRLELERVSPSAPRRISARLTGK